MRRRSWKLWVAGIALVQLLVIGVDVALLWPEPNEAERKAALIRVGMTVDEMYEEWFPECPPCLPGSGQPGLFEWRWGDGSFLAIEMPKIKGERRIISFRTTPPPSVPPLTRLRRTLARLIPALRE